MATIRLELVKNVWQEVGTASFGFTKGGQAGLEMVSAAVLPVGSVPESMLMARSDYQVMHAVTDPWFVRTLEDTAVFKYTEVG